MILSNARSRLIRQRYRKMSLVAIGLILIATRASAQEKVLRWHDNLERGVEAAGKSGKPLFVVFRCVR